MIDISELQRLHEMATPKERPILMHARSIRGILEGRKTQTRRIIKDTPIAVGPDWSLWYDAKYERQLNAKQFAKFKCPYGKPGDRLWVRETWVGFNDPRGAVIVYRANCPDDHFDFITADQAIERRKILRWRPSIFMPRWASRLTLEITDIRVERVQEISEADAKAEGCLSADLATGRECILNPELGSYRLHFQSLWNGTNGKGAWERNDWVWVIEFRQLKEKIQELTK